MGTPVYSMKYAFPEHACTLLVAGGFSFQDETVSKLAHPNTPLGCGVCFWNLTFGGFTHATPDSITARYACFIAKDRFSCCYVRNFSHVAHLTSSTHLQNRLFSSFSGDLEGASFQGTNFLCFFV
ncbi:hypothetical protein MKW92_017834 [Papaver armeniacum]|nr:hypothetical protein MKW92_017834 [Papaver armeniacum]